MRDFLLEVGVEELPARFVNSSVQQLESKIKEEFTSARISFGACRFFATPRRFSVLVTDVAENQGDLNEEVKGPPKNIAIDKEGNLTKAGKGFARSQGVEEEALFYREVNGVDYLWAKRFTKGQATADVLREILPNVVKGVTFSKNMRWGNGDMRYARPLRWLVALFGTDVIPFSLEGLVSDRVTYGHRQLASDPIPLSQPREYEDALEKGYVIADQNRRRQMIVAQAEKIALEQGGKALMDEELLIEVTNLVEYPTAFSGTFRQDYLAIPQEVLITTMQEHQRYFPVVDGKGQLLPLFIGVRNGANNHIELVVSGNERVLNARLSDAKFFYDEDIKANLDKNVLKLKNVVFQEGLGTVYDKVLRIKDIAVSLADLLGEDSETIKRTAMLSKSDLVSHMVYEFPELQGIIGEKYALLAGELKQVAQGIREHYMPRYAGDSLPKTTEGVLVALSDKLDTLVGYFGLGKIPTGSQDPFALRRQALGIVQILVEKQIPIPLQEMVRLVLNVYGSRFAESAQVEKALLEFFQARLKMLLLDEGYRYDTIDAVLSGDKVMETQTIDLFAKTSALDKFRESELYLNIHVAFERMANLANKAEHTIIEDSALTDSDLKLRDSITHLEEEVSYFLGQGKFEECLSVLAQFRPAIDQFFDAVMVMDEDRTIRANRLALLKKAVGVYRHFADFSIIVANM